MCLLLSVVTGQFYFFLLNVCEKSFARSVSVLFTSKRRPCLGVVVLITIVFTRHTAVKDYTLLRPLVVVTSFRFTESWIPEFLNVFLPLMAI